MKERGVVSRHACMGQSKSEMEMTEQGTMLSLRRYDGKLVHMPASGRVRVRTEGARD